MDVRIVTEYNVTSGGEQVAPEQDKHQKHEVVSNDHIPDKPLFVEGGPFPYGEHDNYAAVPSTLIK